MDELIDERSQTTPAPPGPTTPPVLGDRCRHPSVEFENAKFEGVKGKMSVNK